MSYRLAIVEDHALFRAGLRVLIDPKEFTVVAESGDGRNVYELVRDSTPDVLIVDLLLPGTNGVSVIRDALRAQKTRILVLTMYRTVGHAAEAFEAGALGYAVKDQPAEDILAALQQVARGRPYVDPKLPQWLLDPRDRVGAQGLMGDLSPREREVLHLIVQGMSNETAAKELAISVKTLETHRAKINRKLHVHSPAELMRFAARHGLLPDAL